MMCMTHFFFSVCIAFEFWLTNFRIYRLIYLPFFDNDHKFHDYKTLVRVELTIWLHCNFIRSMFIEKVTWLWVTIFLRVLFGHLFQICSKAGIAKKGFDKTSKHVESKELNSSCHFMACEKKWNELLNTV